MHTCDEDLPAVAQGRRRSVDIGGLHLALGDEGSGQGWVGWEECARSHPCYAELLSDMYTQTHAAVNTDEHLTLLVIPDKTRRRLIRSLDSWHFEPHKLPDEEVLFCSLILFEALFRIEGLPEAVQVSINQISHLLCNLRQVYRSQNSYHNFAHALDVLQATHTILRSAGRVPPVSILRKRRKWRPDNTTSEGALVTCLEREDLFCLYVAAIGHDVGHPGFTNVFMKNAGAPLSSLYNDQSALEQMHCTLLLHTLRRQGLGFLLDNPRSGASFRKLLLETVLATDMRVHADFMERLKGEVDGEQSDLWNRKVLICQAIIKCADISNPCRPLRVSQHWATALTEEWTSQALLEKFLQLPATVKASDDPLSEAKGQVFFIQQFAKPLFDLAVHAVPEMKPYAAQCDENLKVWLHRSISYSAPATAEPVDERPVSPSQLPEEYLTVFPMTLPSSLLRSEHDDWPSTHVPSDASCSSRSSSPSPLRAPVALSAVASSPPLSAPPRVPPHMLPPLSTTSTSTGTSPSTPSPISPSDVRSEISDTPSRLSAAAASTLGSMGASAAGSAAIRAAYKASVRKKTSFHRNSWNPAPGAFRAPKPPPVAPAPS